MNLGVFVSLWQFFTMFFQPLMRLLIGIFNLVCNFYFETDAPIFTVDEVIATQEYCYGKLRWYTNPSTIVNH